MRTSAFFIALASFCGLCHADRLPIGADVPWMSYEAELCKTNGLIVGPDYTGSTAAREASGRRYVRLSTVGDRIEFVAQQDAQGLVLRYSIPDSDTSDSSLSLSINGNRHEKLKLTSRLSHLYGPYPFVNDPSAGAHRNYWDEARLFTGAVRKGDVIVLEKTNEDHASEYLIDFVELEQIPPPLEGPLDALSITDFGAVANDESDDREALIRAIGAAKAQHKIVWIPAGMFVIGGPVELAEVTIQGEGMWYSILAGADDYTPAHRLALNGVGSNVHLSDFSIVGKLNYRNDSEPNDAIGGSFGTGSTLRNLWIEHTKAGIWVVNSDGLLIENCRFRNTLADGVNLCVGMRNTVVRNCTARGTGDDCFAIWPATYTKADFSPGNNRFERCTAQLPFLAQGFSIYGGEGNSVIGCEAIDIPYGCGLFASTTFKTDVGFRGITTYANCRVERAGDREGAIGTVANRSDLVGLHFDTIEIVDSPFDAVRFMSVFGGALRETSLNAITVRNAGLAGNGYGIVAADDAVGSIKLSNVSISGARSGLWRNVSPTFSVVMEDGTESLVQEGSKAAPTK